MYAVLPKSKFMEAMERVTRKETVVECPELDCSVRLRELNGEETDQWEAANKERLNSRAKVKVLGTFDSHMVGLSMLDDQGARMFTRTQDMLPLMKLPQRTLRKLADACYELNKRTKEEQEAIRKNSSTTLEKDSGSNSPE